WVAARGEQQLKIEGVTFLAPSPGGVVRPPPSGGQYLESALAVLGAEVELVARPAGEPAAGALAEPTAADGPAAVAVVAGSGHEGGCIVEVQRRLESTDDLRGGHRTIGVDEGEPTRGGGGMAPAPVNRATLAAVVVDFLQWLQEGMGSAAGVDDGGGLRGF